MKIDSQIIYVCKDYDEYLKLKRESEINEGGVIYYSMVLIAYVAFVVVVGFLMYLAFEFVEMIKDKFYKK